jgi:hypothetical protein
MVRDEEERLNSCSTPYSLSLELGENREKKFEAFRKHQSQAMLLEKAPQIYETADFERYLLVAVRGVQEAGADKSLFHGVVED